MRRLFYKLWQYNHDQELETLEMLYLYQGILTKTKKNQQAEFTYLQVLAIMIEFQEGLLRLKVTNL